MKISQKAELGAGAAQVWDFVSDFYNFASWQPHIAAVEPGEQEGERIVHMKRGNSVRDRIVERDDQARILSYAMIPDQDPPPGAPVIEDMLATFTVTEAGSGCVVDYTISVTVPKEIEPMAEKGIGADISAALDGLKARFA